MNAVPTRDELFEMAARPIGGSGFDQDVNGHIRAPEAIAAAKRAAKVWLPCGKRSPNSNEAREAEKLLKGAEFDLEDAIEAAGGCRGSVGH